MSLSDASCGEFLSLAAFVCDLSFSGSVGSVSTPVRVSCSDCLQSWLSIET